MPPTELRSLIHGVLGWSISAEIVDEVVNVAVDVVVKGWISFAVGQERADRVFSRGQPLVDVKVGFELYNPRMPVSSALELLYFRFEFLRGSGCVLLLWSLWENAFGFS